LASRIGQAVNGIKIFYTDQCAALVLADTLKNARVDAPLVPVGYTPAALTTQGQLKEQAQSTDKTGNEASFGNDTRLDPS